jgi:hypothetical protein
VYYADLTEYEYFRPPRQSGHAWDILGLFRRKATTNRVLNVGWLDNEHEFRHGRIPADLLEYALKLCEAPVNQTKGLHHCPFCQESAWAGSGGIIAERQGPRLLLGSAEIRVAGHGGLVYAAPNMIYHYMQAHQYLPPDEFIEALQTCRSHGWRYDGCDPHGSIKLRD